MNESPDEKTTEAAQDSDGSLGRMLLLVAGVLLVLWAGVSFLAMYLHATGRLPARRAECASHLKQLGLAIQMYSERYQGRLPLDSSMPTLVGSMQLLSNVCPTAEILFCPGDRRRGAKAEKDFRKLTTLNISYAYVPNVMWQDEASDSIVALDRIYTPSAGDIWPTDGNHKDIGGNILFNDGHVEFRQRLPSTLKDKNGKVVVLSP